MAIEKEDVAKMKKIAAKYDFDLEGYSTYDLGKVCNELLRNPVAPYARKGDFTSYAAYKGGKVLAANATMEIINELKVKTPDLLVESVLDEEGYKKARRKYEDAQREVTFLFRIGLFYMTEMLDNPKAEKAYSIAYEKEHSSGYADVAMFFDDLVELIKE